MTDQHDIPSLLRDFMQLGLDAVQPIHCLPPHLPTDAPAGRQFLLAVGKAAASMAAVAVQRLPIDGGLIVAPHGTIFAPQPAAMPPGALRCITASHPVPDQHSLAAGEAAMALVASLRPADRLIALISGGGSALMVMPRAGITLADKLARTKAMLASGASIAEINRERMALSQIKGGGLARMSGTSDIRTIIMSDVPGDDPALVASGPTISAMGDANVAVCANADTMLTAVAAAAQAKGLAVSNLGGAIEGDAVAVAREHAAMAMAAAMAARQSRQPLLIVSGGETSVRVDYPAEAGGRNLTYALALADALDGIDGIVALAVDSDGIDGNSQVAGAIIDGYSAQKIRASGRSPGDALARNRSFDALDAIGATIWTGPTGVNVNDLRIIYVAAAALPSTT